jgi:hypothetical protein
MEKNRSRRQAKKRSVTDDVFTRSIEVASREHEPHQNPRWRSVGIAAEWHNERNIDTER